MGSLFRSEEMTCAQLYLQQEAAYSCVVELGELGLTEFRDLNTEVNAFQKKFINEVRRCDEMERKLRFFEKEIKKEGMPIIDPDKEPEAPQQREMVDLEMTFDRLENEVKVVNKNTEELKRTYLNLTELKHMLKKTQQFFNEVDLQIHETGLEDESIQLLGEDGIRVGGQHSLKLEFVSGVILRERLPSFERMLWTVCRGNVFLRQAEIETPLEDPVTGENVYKSVFIIFFQGEQLKSRVKKVCEGYHATLYPCPETAQERTETIGDVVSRIEELNTVLNQTIEHRRLVLVAAAKNIKTWFVKVRKLKSIYMCLNYFNLDVTKKCLIAECWFPTQDRAKIEKVLLRGSQNSGASVNSILESMSTDRQPPTFNRTNKFTSGFQNIVDSYGVAKYREVNPAPFTIITFPFIFAIMFGDAGHGLIMFLAALVLVLKERSITAAKSRNEIFNTFFNGRYMILLMGIFSIYTGILYNDCFAKSINLFGSSWKVPNITEKYPNIQDIPEDRLDAKDSYGNAYIFGVDPMWQLAKNKILFLNSYKMKISIIFGVCQMLFGVILSLWNHTYNKNRINIFCQFIPEIIFLLTIFGYMVLIIIAKWLSYTSENSGCAPSILIVLINMFLMNYPDDSCSVREFYAFQKPIQITLLVLALACVPWMLAVKPFLLKKQHQQKQLLKERVNYNSSSHRNNGFKEESTASGDQVSVTVEHEHPEHADEEFDFADTLIYQSIHTIEYCLGSVSHTASYLRLWALSLAHSQLSEVLWNMVMTLGLMPKVNFYGGFMLVPIFAFWATLTVVVLLVMEGLSAFLHALRLHWVEFQSKFYSGSGHMFAPFSFKHILEAAEADV